MFDYDANGNLLTNGEHSLVWTPFNKPYSIKNETNGHEVKFHYGVGKQRIQRIEGTKITTYFGGGTPSFFEKTVDSQTQTVEKRWFYAVAGDVIAIDSLTDNDALKRYYLHKDFRSPLNCISRIK